jgi:hypothetical protein
MGKIYHSIDESLRSFIGAQHVFFVATAPSSGGHINLSPKGLDTLRVIDDRTVAYVDYIGSGAETIAHLRDDGRIVLMMCAFEGSPKIVRLHGHGDVIEPQDADYAVLSMLFPPAIARRSVIRVRIERISDSCGYGVPLYGFKSDRDQLGAWAERKGEAGLLEYQRKNNRKSLDGLPALRWTEDTR